MTSDPPRLRVESQGVVATLRIENPGKRNAVTAQMWRQFVPTLAAIAADPRVKVLVVRGAGDDFSAGADIRDLELILHDSSLGDGGHLTAAERSLAEFPLPTIAAIDGYCVGGGWQLAAACDIRIASDRASFGVTPSRIGIVYPLSGIERLVGIAGPAVAKYLLFSGDLVSAATAERFGLVSMVIEAEHFDAEVSTFSDCLAGRSQLSIHAMKQIVDSLVGAGDASRVNDRWQAEVARSEDPAIGAAAFAAKRPPEFTWSPESSSGSRG